MKIVVRVELDSGICAVSSGTISGSGVSVINGSVSIGGSIMFKYSGVFVYAQTTVMTNSTGGTAKEDKTNPEKLKDYQQPAH